ncbi:trimeric intracellular cation channel family protein [Rhodobacteraceae bacterium RKSG542]|uniref:trimeric intracellular cation channel family protein n=1 Tax=Pseudovibrio flavus TaxID=2529854 RepID=UPI0012BBB301|nr:trimeric intracellular cation channel family protein [Pseudovibrio flavus]MTI17798.1 trimeric intracellular cation channel family protein [Pseudovibrio flavus]
MPEHLWQVLDLVGVAVFAVTGGLVAARLRQDFIAFLFFCTLTGIGGGTMRDLLLGVPVFWVENETYIYVCFVVTIFMWYFSHWVETWGKPLRWFDAIGLAAYCVMGSAKALSVGDVYSVAVMMGVCTATVGGIVRDIVAGQPSVLSQRDIYVSAAFMGSCTYVASVAVGLSDNIGVILGFCVALVLRGGALLFDWTLPTYRTPEEKKDS